MISLLERKTRIGIAGARADSKSLFEIAAASASRATGARIEIVWLAGLTHHQVDARLVVDDSLVVRGKADFELEVHLTGRSHTDLPAISTAFVQLLQQLS